MIMISNGALLTTLHLPSENHDTIQIGHANSSDNSLLLQQVSTPRTGGRSTDDSCCVSDVFMPANVSRGVESKSSVDPLFDLVTCHVRQSSDQNTTSQS